MTSYPRRTRTKKTYKFMQVLERSGPYTTLVKLSKRRGITLQELLRAVVIPEWIENEEAKMNRAAAFLGKYLMVADKLAKKYSRPMKNRNIHGRRSLGAKNGHYRDKGRRPKIRARPS